MKTLSPRDREILRALIFHVGAFTARQLISHWWPQTAAGRKNGARRIRLLCERKLIVTKTLHVKAIRGVQLIGVGGPGLSQANPAVLSKESTRRWDLPIRRASVVIASERARQIFGGLPRRSFHALHSLNHCLGVSQMYLELLRNRPDLVSRWIGEHEFDAPAFREAQPDALIASPSGEPERAFEFGAAYSTTRYQRLQQMLEEKQLPYEIYGAA